MTKNEDRPMSKRIKNNSFLMSKSISFFLFFKGFIKGVINNL